MTRSLGSTDLKRLHREWRRQAPGRVGLLLDSVATPANVGSILRTAAAMRVDDVWLCGQTPDPTHAGVGKTALGSERYLQLHFVEKPTDAVAQVSAAGYRLVAVELAQVAEAIHNVDLTGSVCLAVGHEDRGVTAGVLEAAERAVFIPQLGKIGSLNVATAASIAIYETRRQGWPTAGRAVGAD